MNGFDVIVIGGGVIGCSVLRELSKYGISVCLLEKHGDVASVITRANSGVIHSGFNVPEGSLKSKFNIEGLKLIEPLCEELGVPYRMCGKLTVADDEKGFRRLEAIYERGKRIGLTRISMIGEDEIRSMEPAITAKYALNSPYSGVMSPFLYTAKLADNAVRNGAQVRLLAGVDSIKRQDDLFVLVTDQGEFSAKFVVNAAGLNSDMVARMIDPEFPHRIYPCRGEYLVSDEYPKGQMPINSMIYPVPDLEKGVLGIHVTPTTENNVIIGPSAEFVDACSEIGNTKDAMDALLREGTDLVSGLEDTTFIRFFSGLRPKLYDRNSKGGFADFHIAQSDKHKEFINLVGIESPGLTAAVAIAGHVSGMIGEMTSLKKKNNFIPEEPIEKDDEEGRIICRCRKVSEQKIRLAMNNGIGAVTLDSVKIRTHAMMGRCQGGFCAPKIAGMLIEEKGVNHSKFIKNRKGSNLFTGDLK